jgi:hypothetical protein
MTTQQQRIKAPSEALPSDGLSRFIRAGAWAAIISGLALAASLLVEWLVVPFERLGQTEAYLTGAYLLSAGLRLLSTILLLWALLGIYGRQSRAAGTFGLWAFVVAFFGTALQAGETWAEVFVYPTFARVAPNILLGHATEASSFLVSSIFLSALLLSIGIILFGVSTLMARVYPRWSPILLIVSIPVTMVFPNTSGTFSESIGQILFGIAVAALGFYALRTAPSNTSSSQGPRA